MAEEINLEVLKSRGLTCGKLRNMEKDSFSDAKKFRESGFNNIADVEEQVASKIKNLREKICLLK